jgi:membrane-associated phospholipid phosphatase
MNRNKALLVLFIILHLTAKAQVDSIPKIVQQKNKSWIKQSIVPLTLIGTGLFINYSSGTFSKENIQDGINDAFPDFSTNADDFLMFVPALTMYTADLLKVESKNDAFTQTKYLLISGIVTNIVTFGIKHLSNETRPNGEDELSLPSGHTSNAFVMATVLFHEFKDTKPVLAYSGFVFASATGVLRVLNNEHWTSDVLVGAGIGIIITDLVYRFEPLKNWNPFKNRKVSTIISPSYKENTFGLYANIQF